MKYANIDLFDHLFSSILIPSGKKIFLKYKKCETVNLYDLLNYFLCTILNVIVNDLFFSISNEPLSCSCNCDYIF